MAASEWYHQKMAIVGTLDPQTFTAATTVWTDAVDCDVFEKAIFIVQTANVPANSTLTLTVYSDDASATGGMTNTLATATMTAGDDNSQIWVEVDTEDFDVDNRDRYCRGSLVIAGTVGGTGLLSAVVLGTNSRYHPASDYDLATVASIGNS